MRFPHNDEVSIRLLTIFAVIFLFSFPAFAKKKNTPLPTPRSARRIDANYVTALSIANRFLQAWQDVNHEAGLMLLTDNARHQTSPEKLDLFFSPDSTTQRAYQVARGKKLKAGRYTFPVALFEHNPGTPLRSRNSQMIVVQTGKDDWAVDKLP